MQVLIGVALPSTAERLAVAQLSLATDPGTEQLERVRRRAAGVASTLGLVASLIALYDVSLLAGGG